MRPPANAVIEVTCRLVDPPVDRLGAAQDVDPTDYQTLLAVPSTARRIVDRTVQTIIRAGDGPYARATAIRGWLETQCRYDANIRIPEQQYDDAMDYYLVERRGACDLIASAVALMARSAGIPARVAVGYAQGEPQPDGSLIIRTNMAHAWAELYFEGCGWVAFNPAVPGLEAGAGGSGDPTAATGARRRANLGGLVCLAIGVWLIVYGIAQYRRRRPGFAADPSGEVARAYHAALRALRRASMPRRSYETPRGYWRRLAAEQPEAGWLEPFECLTSLYERQRYGLGPLDATDLSTAEAKAGETTENLRREQRSRRRPKRTARGAS